MGEKVQVLDHGYIVLVESWGSDERIIEAARMSTGKGFLGWGPKEGACSKCGVTESEAKRAAVESGRARSFCGEDGLGTDHDWKREPGDEKLLRYLWENKHATPFEMAGMTIEVQAPIFVFREWHRHRTQSYNEMSSRYVPLPDVNYVPSVERLMVNSKTNKQAGTVKGAEELTEAKAAIFQELIRNQYASQQALYEGSLNSGIPKELARIHLGVGRYSRMRASANLRNWFAFLTLRMDTKAQWEIRQYANEVGKLIAEAFPRTWELFAK